MSYKKELISAGLTLKPGIYQIEVKHEARCKIFKGEPCNCKPKFEQVTKGNIPINWPVRTHVMGYDMKIWTVCGAKTRKGTPCQNSRLFKNGRCKLHGGLSTGPKSPEGRARSLVNLKGLRDKDIAAMSEIVQPKQPVRAERRYKWVATKRG